MDEKTVPETVPKRADELVVGDRIQPGFMPAYARSGEGTVRYVEKYHYQGADWIVALFACADGDRNCAHYQPGGILQVIPADTGLAYSRRDEDPQPAAGRTPPHFGAVTDASLVPEPIARHYDASDVGTADCACGESFGNVDVLKIHIALANAFAVPVVLGGHTAVAVAGGLIEIDPPEGYYLVSHGPVKPPYGSPEREAYDREIHRELRDEWTAMVNAEREDD